MRLATFLTTLLLAAVCASPQPALATPEPGEDGCSPYTLVDSGYAITVHELENPLIREYAVGVQLVAKEYLFFRGSYRTTEAFRRIDRQAQRLVTMLFMSPGITRIRLSPKRVQAKIGLAFEPRWNVVQGRIINLIGATLSEQPFALYWDEPDPVNTVLEPMPNQQMQIFHVDRQICEGDTTFFAGKLSSGELAAKLEALGSIGSKIAIELRNKLGDRVQRLCFDSYEIAITLAPTEEWDRETENYIDAVIRAALGNKPFPMLAPPYRLPTPAQLRISIA